MLGFYLLIFITLFSHSLTYALPAKDVRVVLDREYFQITRGVLRNAEKSIQMMMFEASFYANHPKSPSNILIGELISARKRGLKVEVILEASDREGRTTELKVEVILEASDREGRTTERNRLTGKMLSEEGVEVFYDPLFVTTHAKLIIIDGRINLLGSTNWTYHSLTSNHEVGVLIESEEVARTLQYYFDRVKTSGHRN
jgi:phosphatidylserine/phosphatidylglycerophosphate/cardiolipin synthase-like enzyme